MQLQVSPYQISRFECADYSPYGAILDRNYFVRMNLSFSLPKRYTKEMRKLKPSARLTYFEPKLLCIDVPRQMPNRGPASCDSAVCIPRYFRYECHIDLTLSHRKEQIAITPDILYKIIHMWILFIRALFYHCQIALIIKQDSSTYQAAKSPCHTSRAGDISGTTICELK